MHLSENAKRVLNALRDGDHHHTQELAETLDLAPFYVRASLKALKRDQLVRDEIGRRSHDWILTDRGFRVVHSLAQGELFR